MLKTGFIILFCFVWLGGYGQGHWWNNTQYNSQEAFARSQKTKVKFFKRKTWTYIDKDGCALDRRSGNRRMSIKPKRSKHYVGKYQQSMEQSGITIINNRLTKDAKRDRGVGCGCICRTGWRLKVKIYRSDLEKMEVKGFRKLGIKRLAYVRRIGRRLRIIE